MFSSTVSALTTTTALIGFGAGILKGITSPNLLNLGTKSLNIFASALGGMLLGASIEHCINKYKNSIIPINLSFYYPNTIKDLTNKITDSTCTYAYQVSLAAITVGMLCIPTVAQASALLAIIPLYLALPSLLIGGMIWCIKKGYDSFAYLAEECYLYYNAHFEQDLSHHENTCIQSGENPVDY